MKRLHRSITILLIISLIFASTISSATESNSKTIEVHFNSINLTVNNNEVNADNILYGGTTYVPLRAVAEMLGKELTWDGETRTAGINDGNVSSTTTNLQSKESYQDTIEVYFNTINLTVNGVKVEADNILYKGTTYVPLRKVAEMLGKEVDWSDATKTADIIDIVEEIPLKTEKRGNLIGNMKSVIIRNGWVYYSNYVNHVPLTKSEIDGKNVTKLANDIADDFHILDDSLYYTTGDYFEKLTLYKIDTDGKNKKKLVTGKIRSLSIVEDSIYYYLEDDGFYRSDLDGKNKTKILQLDFENNYAFRNFNVSNGWIYFVGIPKAREFYLYRAKLDGTDTQKLSEDVVDQYTVDGNWLYYTKIQETGDTGIYKMKTDGTDKTKLFDNGLTHSVRSVYGDWIYVSKGAYGTNGIQKIKKMVQSILALQKTP